jgi:hypothetical protein
LRKNCLLQQVIEGKIKVEIEVTGRRGRRRRKLVDDLKERRGYFNLKEEALDRTMWRAGFGGGFGPVVRQTATWMKDLKYGAADILNTINVKLIFLSKLRVKYSIKWFISTQHKYNMLVSWLHVSVFYKTIMGSHSVYIKT